jgi:hypothetical protein
VAEGTASSFLSALELGIGLDGVESQGDLIAFQRLVLGLESERRAEEMEKEATLPPDSGHETPQMNTGYQPGGGGRRVETRSYTNASAKTGKSPEQLIEEYQQRND